MSQINPANTLPSAEAPTNKFSDLSSSEFIKIMFTELTNQDPLQPNDSNELLNQLSSLRTIESQTALQDQLKSLVSQNQIAMAGNLIGKRVEGLDLNNDAIEGVVSSVRVANDRAVLLLDTGQELPMERLRFITGEGGEEDTATLDAINALADAVNNAQPTPPPPPDLIPGIRPVML
ncbi:MAG: flagellar hook assembly protein FlgD [Planctomycetota bacterium]|jgi:flagellar basal-body rod modification protein FlgD